MDEFNYKPPKHHKIKDYWIPALFMAGFLVFTGWLVVTKVIPGTQDAKLAFDDLKSQIIENQNISKEALEALKEKPPEHSSNGLTTKTVGKQTIVSEGNLTDEQVSHLNQLSASAKTGVTPADLKFTDTTGQYSSLIGPLKTYMSNSLLWTARELPSLYEVRLVNVGASGWAGMYNGGYMTSGGQITSVTAYIDLNVYYYQSSPYILEYLQLTLSHEYGHHYTLYNKWLTYNLSYYNRFPDSYYQTRPLSVSSTAADYSKGWANCDAEIIAEDYKYLFSPYKNHQMAGTYGFPSDPSTRNYLLAFGGGTDNTDRSAPSVSVSAPANGATISGQTTLKATASDNIAVTSVDFYINDQLIGSAGKVSADWQLSYNTTSLVNGSYSLKAKASDQAGNSAQSAVLTVNISNAVPDTTPPSVQINSPTNGQTVSGTLTFSASVSDNVHISYANLKIDSTTLASKTVAPYAVDLNTLSYPNGSHSLSVVASDGTNTTTKQITITINNSAVADTENPTIQITAPSSSPFDWVSDNLTLTAIGTDNVSVTKIEFYINETLVATENNSTISRRWLRAGTPNGSYTLKAKAYDSSGNTAEVSVTINKTF